MVPLLALPAFRIIQHRASATIVNWSVPHIFCQAGFSVKNPTSVMKRHSVHVHVYLPTDLPTYLPTGAHTDIHAQVHTYTYIHPAMHACMHACIHAYMYIHMHAFIRTSDLVT